MNTKIYTLNEENIDTNIIKEAGEVLKKGGLVAFPTETVYGLGGDALNPDSSKKIYAAKGRPSDNPLIVHISNLRALGKIVKDIPSDALKLADKYWPGPLTMIFNKNDVVPKETTGGLETVAVRMPSNKIARALIDASGGYIAAPSANLSGRPSPTVAKYVIEDMDGRIDVILDGGESDVGLESTIVDFTEGKPMILRPGYITQKMLEEALSEKVEWDRAIIDADSKTPPKAPGMKYRHYAPKGELVIVEGNKEDVIKKINELTNEDKNNNLKTGVIATEETKDYYNADLVKSAGHKDKENEVAHHLFRILREFDEENIQKMYSESFKSDGVGAAVMNRLLKAAGHQIIKV
ncbi:MAG: threonylcarbamoyl-AMP synthase [Lachnospiraceae bacterium]|nr:threonylcarbamoyl-AMP synthase [Lachnospiraceae bacterium]